VVISKIIGGLGNQMFQYAVGKAISKEKNLILKLDITGYVTYKLHNGYRLNLFNIEENIAQNNEIKYLRGMDNVFFKILRILKLYKKVSYYKEKERTIYDNNIFLCQEIYLDGYWQNEKYFLSIRNLLIKEFTPKEDLSFSANKYLNQIKLVESVSIHVRRGDYLNHPEIGILGLDYYQRSIDYMSGRVLNPVFFIFSNDLKWCIESFKFIKNVVYISDTKTEIDDMVLMKNCHHNIIANSSFSWWGAWLNENDERVVVAPKKWLAINPKNYKWSPSSWVEI